MKDDKLKAFWATTLSGAHTLDGPVPAGTLKPGTFSGGETLAPDPTADDTADAELGVGGAEVELLDEIGRGGMGIVYQARQKSLDRLIAVKRILPGKDNESVRGRFVSEALVTGELDHPNIVPVHDLARSGDGQVHLAMKLVSGTSWDDLLRRGRDLERDLDILLAVGNAVAFAHSKGIVHRDLKPENVMVGEFGEVLVMDWGIAVDVRESPPGRTRAQHRSTVRAPAGTPSYMAPELAEARGTDIGPATDVYLLGAILHELLTGHPPHRGATLMEVLMAASRSEPPRFEPAVPAELQAICHRALAHNPVDRYAGVGDFQDALRAFRQHRESMAISDGARATLDRCAAATSAKARDDTARNLVYADFTEAVAGFRQALVLWDGNRAARDGEREARIAFARTALQAGDLGLAEAQAAPLENDGGLRNEIATAQAARDRASRNARLMRRGLAAAALLIVAGLTVGFLLVTNEKRKTEDALGRETIAKNDERKLRLRAELRQAEARREAERAGLEAWRGKLTAARALSDRGAQFLEADTPLKAGACYLRALELAPDAAPERYPSTWLEPSWAKDAWTAWRFVEREFLPALQPLQARGGHSHYARRGNLIALATAQYVYTFDAATGRGLKELIVKTAGLPIRTLAITPDQDVILVATGQAIAVLDARTGEERRRFVAHTGLVAQIVVSSTGKTAISRDDGHLRAWTIATGKQVGQVAVAVKSIAPVRDTTTVRAAGRFTQSWDWKTSTTSKWSLDYGKENAPHVIVASPDGVGHALGSRDGKVRVYFETNGQGQVTTLELERYVLDFAYSPDGSRLLAFLGGGRVVEIDVATRKILRTAEHAVRGFSGRAGYSPQGVPEIVDLNSGYRYTIADDNRPVHLGTSKTVRVTAIAMADDGGFVVTGYDTGHLTIWDMPSGKIRRQMSVEIGHKQAIQSITIADGRLYTDDGVTLLVWDLHKDGPPLARRKTVQQGRILPRAGVLIRYFKKLLGRTVALHDLASGKKIADLEVLRPGAIAIGESRDGTTVFVAHRFGVDAFDARTGRKKDSYECDGKAQHVVAGPDGVRLLVAEEHVAARGLLITLQPPTRMARIRIVDRRARRVLREQKLPGTLSQLAFLADTAVAVLHIGNEVAIRDIRTGRLLRRFVVQTQGTDKSVRKAIVSPDGAYLLVHTDQRFFRFPLLRRSAPTDPPKPDRTNFDNPYREFVKYYTMARTRIVRSGPTEGTLVQD